MDHGSVWGHGTLRGMDFSADTLHSIGQHMRDFMAAGNQPRAGAYDELPAERRREIDAEVIYQIHVNRYNPETKTLELTPAQAYALAQIRKYWEKEFSEGDARLRFSEKHRSHGRGAEQYRRFLLLDGLGGRHESARIDLLLHNNWPADRSVGNSASTEALVWSIGSILSLFAVLGLVVYVVHRYGFFYGESRAVEAAYRLLEMPVTPSQRASAKFFLVAGLLFVVQIFNGGLLAHYTVHPGSFYVKFIGQMYPYSWAKTWHLQLAILWIAVSWMGTAVYLARWWPAASRRDSGSWSISSSSRPWR